jgi:hypothetical protein
LEPPTFELGEYLLANRSEFARGADHGDRTSLEERGKVPHG